MKVCAVCCFKILKLVSYPNRGLQSKKKKVTLYLNSVSQAKDHKGLHNKNATASKQTSKMPQSQFEQIRDHRLHRSPAQRDRDPQSGGHQCKTSVSSSSQPCVMHTQQASSTRPRGPAGDDWCKSSVLYAEARPWIVLKGKTRILKWTVKLTGSRYNWKRRTVWGLAWTLFLWCSGFLNR